MRTKLKDNQVLHLLSTGEEAMAREVIIVKMIGMGASVIAYEATDPTRQIHYVLKECYPENGAARLADGTICWKDSDIEAKAKSRMRRAYEMQLALQNESATENTNTHLVDTIFEGNNTLYTITDHRNATTYDNIDDKTLQETFTTARSIAKALKAYHDNGYLHLDVKPKNIMIMPETRDMVLLLDFDSITRMDAVAESILSYSPNYAAPEQLQGRVSKICAATDVYAVGTIVFQRVFSRLPGLEDQSIYSEWDYSSNLLFEKLSMTVRRLTTEFFRKTLSASVKNRYQTMDEAIAALDILVEECDPKKRFIIDAPPVCFNTFVGRTAELEEIHKKLRGNKPVFITGMKGIGKTELARNYARTYRNDYDVIRFAEYDGSLAELISSGNLVKIENDSDEILTTDTFAGLVDEHTLLIIDNYHTEDGSTSDDELFDELASLKSKLLITTYENAQDIYETAEWIELEELSSAEQYNLFEEEYGEALSDHEATLTKQILKEIRGYTLLIPLIAKLLKNSYLGFEDVYQSILETGTSDIPGKVRHKKDSKVYKATVADIVSTVLDISNLSEEEHYVLNCLAALRGIRIGRAILAGWIGSQYDEAIKSLVVNHWISLDGQGKNALITMHDVIRDVVWQDKSLSYDTSWIQKPIDEYIKDIDRSHQSFTYMTDSFPEHVIEIVHPLSGVNAIQISKKKKLIETLLLLIDSEKEPEKLISIFYSIIKLELKRAYNYLPNDRFRLSFIETSEKYDSLSMDDKLHLHFDLMFLALKSLCDYDRKREEGEVKALCRDAINQAEWILSRFYRYRNRKVAFGIIHHVYRAFLEAGATLGYHLFTTDYPAYSETALFEYTEFVNTLADGIRESFHDFIPRDEEHQYYPFELRNDYFNRCMRPGSDDQLWKEFEEEEQGMEQADAQDYQKYVEFMANHAEDENQREQFRLEQQVSRIRGDAYELVKQCEEKGYIAVINPEAHPEINIDRLTDPALIKEASKKLALAKKKYDAANRIVFDDLGNISPPDIDKNLYNWLEVSCIVSCCSGKLDSAKKYYAEYLISAEFGWLGLFGGYANLKMYNTLQYLGFSDICPDILRLNIQHMEKQILEAENKSAENSGILNSREAVWDAVCSILEQAELLGDKMLIKKYSEKKKQLEDTGFEFEA